jgi:hypothetical protein
MIAFLVAALGGIAVIVTFWFLLLRLIDYIEKRKEIDK